MQDEIRNRLNRAVDEKVFPGGVVGVIKSNGERLVVPVGSFTYEAESAPVREETVFDVASLTKSIPTGTVALKLVEEDRLSLDDPLIKYIPEYANAYREKVLIRHLLTYSLVGKFPTPGFSYQTATRESMTNGFYTVDLKYPPGEVFQYSNYPSILLTNVLERITGKTINVLGREYFFDPLNMHSATFFPTDKAAVPPTEVDDWRGLMQGVVHDETAYIIERDGGVLGCAGLFVNVPDILTFIEMLLHQGEFRGTKYFIPDTVKAMYTNQLDSIGASMGLGWELNESRFMGKYVSKTTFGKTGFTGTSCVQDVTRGLGYVLLSNRTFPKRSDTKAINEVRRDISDIVFKP